MAELKAIETKYDGHVFRSRTEARWAVFFRSAGIAYEYEPQGFELPDGTKYLPDFWLPEIDAYFEVKGTVAAYNESNKKLVSFVQASGKDIVVAVGAPNQIEEEMFIILLLAPQSNVRMVLCSFCVLFANLTKQDNLAIRDALASGRSARFEYGQSGAVTYIGDRAYA